MPSILIGGDVVPRLRTRALFESGEAEALFGDLLEEFEAADLSIVNLECPLIECENPIEKTGAVLGAPARCIRGLEEARVDAVNLANNHILDHGPQGLRSTLEACRASGIDTVGAGENLGGAERMLIRDAGGMRVGMLSLAEHEWSIAGPDTAGAAPLDLARFMRTLRRNDGAYDFLVVLVHVGVAHYPYPSPQLKDTCRFLVEEGARVVVCQHSHRPGCVEWYQDSLIVYGQGNLLFDEQPRNPPWWHEGFLVRLSVGQDRQFSAEMIPYIQCRETPGASRMPAEEERRFLETLDRRSRAIEDDAFVREQWLAFCAERQSAYLSALRGHGEFLRRLHGRLPWLRLLYGRHKCRAIQNLVRCESHREVIETICRLPESPGDGT